MRVSRGIVGAAVAAVAATTLARLWKVREGFTELAAQAEERQAGSSDGHAAVAGSVMTVRSVAVAGSAMTQESSAVAGSAATTRSAAVAGSAATSYSTAVAGSALTLGSAAVAGWLMTESP